MSEGIEMTNSKCEGAENVWCVLGLNGRSGREWCEDAPLRRLDIFETENGVPLTLLRAEKPKTHKNVVATKRKKMAS